MSRRSSLAEALRCKIASGAFGAGERLPSQAELVKRYGCSRSTVVRALEELRRGGLVDGRRGTGVFVPQGDFSGVRRVFVVCSYRTPSQYDPYVIAVNEVSSFDYETTFISSLTLGERQEALCQRGNVVIWLRPGESDLPFIAHLERIGQPQLLVNRHYGDYDALWSDAEDGIRRGVSWLVEHAGKEIAFIAPLPVIGKPYVAERMMQFYEACFALGATLCDELIFKSDFADLVSEIDDVAGKIFQRARPPRGIFTLNYKMAVPLVISALKYGKQLGRDYYLLVFDDEPRLRGKDGVAMIGQPYQLMSKEVGLWLKMVASGTRPSAGAPLRKALECTLELPPES